MAVIRPPTETVPMPELEPMFWTLPPDPQAAALARRHLSTALSGMAEEALGVLQLLVTEVVTNALRHGSHPITLRLSEHAAGVLCEVGDGGVGLPRQRTPQALDTGGRGLQIVDALAAAWGVVRASGGSGKTVWFEVAVPALQRQGG